MSHHEDIQYGSLQEKDNVITYEIPKEKTNIVEVEQLEELKRNNRSFFDCLAYEVEESLVRIHYKRNKSYRKISKFYNADNALKLKIVSNLLTVENLIGTQFTTIIHPDNIYVNNDAEVKFAHRGIRSVLPPKEMDVVKLIQDIKDMILYLFSSQTFDEIKATKYVDVKDPMINSIQSATSIEQMKHIIQTKSTPANTDSKPSPKPKEQVPEQTEKTTTVKAKQVKPKKERTNTALDQNPQKQPKKKTSLLSGLLIGVLIGMLALYAVKVMPLTKETAAVEKESDKQQEVLTEEKEALQADLDKHKTVINAYHAAVSGETEEAINLFEQADNLDKEAKETLISQYINLNTIESLTKAAEMSDAHKVRAVNGLVGLNSKEANEAILNIESDEPEIKIEQAWINKEHDDVVKLYQSNSDNDRAKFLAAKSYIELKKTKEAMKLGKELKNKDIQIASLEKDIELVKADKKMKKDKKKDKTKELEKQIKKLKK